VSLAHSGIRRMSRSVDVFLLSRSVKQTLRWNPPGGHKSGFVLTTIPNGQSRFSG
jgi:hypothetical protein